MPSDQDHRTFNVTRHFGNQAEASVAVNPASPLNVVIVAGIINPGLFEGYTFDGGLTWTTRLIASGNGLGLACCDPSLAFDGYGNLFLTYLAQGGGAIVAALSTDGGASFRFLDRVRAASPGLPPIPVDQPTVVTGPGSVWFSWVYSGEPTSVEARGASVAGLGEVGVLTPVQQAPGSRGSNFVDIAVGPEGQVVLVRQDHAGSEGPSNLWVHVDPDGLGPSGFGRGVLATSTNVGGTEHIPAQSGRTIDAEAGLAYDRSGGPFDGRVYLAYTDEDPPESDDTDILVRSSDDDGSTWSEAVAASDDPGHNSQFLPRIALDQSTGFLAVSWHDARGDLGDGGPGDTNGIPNDDASFYATVGMPGGAAFLPSIRLAGSSNAAGAFSALDFGDYTGLSFAGGVFFPAWADNSNSTKDNPDGRLHAFDVYTATVVVDQSW